MQHIARSMRAIAFDGGENAQTLQIDSLRYSTYPRECFQDSAIRNNQN